MSKFKSKHRRGPKHIPPGVKLSAVERMKLGANVTELARQVGVHRSMLYVWKQQWEDPVKRAGVIEIDPRQQRIRELEQQVVELEGVLGRRVMELDFFERALRGSEKQPGPDEHGGRECTPPLPGNLTRKANPA